MFCKQYQLDFPMADLNWSESKWIAFLDSLFFRTFFSTSNFNPANNVMPFTFVAKWKWFSEVALQI